MHAGGGKGFVACGLPNPRLTVRHLMMASFAPVTCPKCIVAQARLRRGVETERASA